ncbi:MAG: DNA repair protein RecO, partial [Clostridia bacterium]|nr:DNA repair protein RecO [Clostridia bacterium]
MNLVNTSAVVIMHTNFGEADKILTLFSPTMGKLQVLCKGCRRTKSSLLSASQIFCYGDYLLFKGKNLYTLSQCNVFETFYSLRNDLKRLGYSSYIINLCREAVQEGQPNPRLFNLLVNILKQISYSDQELEKLVLIFELKYLDILGYKPYLHDCVNCNQRIYERDFRFSTKFNGIICNKCLKYDLSSLKLSIAAFKTMSYILENDIG